MTASSISALLGSAAHDAATAGQVPLWRCTFHTSDPRAKVGRRLGDGSVKQGRQVIRAIVDTGIAWINKVVRITDKEGRSRKLQWELMRSLQAVLGFCNFATGEIVATYEMIARAAGCCRMTAIRHMAALRELKWIDWVRRSEPGGAGEKASWAPNAYFFEVSRLPIEVQIHLRQILKRQGVTLDTHPERRGSGPVPNRAQRLAERLAKGFAAMADREGGEKRRRRLLDDAAFIRGEMALFGDIPAEKWAKLRHPDDPAAQVAYNRRLGLISVLAPSHRNAPDSGTQNEK